MGAGAAGEVEMAVWDTLVDAGINVAVDVARDEAGDEAQDEWAKEDLKKKFKGEVREEVKVNGKNRVEGVQVGGELEELDELEELKNRKGKSRAIKGTARREKAGKSDAQKGNAQNGAVQRGDAQRGDVQEGAAQRVVAQAWGAWDRPIAFHRSLVRLGVGVTGALLLSQALYWSRRTRDADGWFYKTQAQWEAETGLTRYEQESARRRLVASGYLDEQRRGVPCRLFFRVDVRQVRRDVEALGVRSSVQDWLTPVCGDETDQPVDVAQALYRSEMRAKRGEVMGGRCEAGATGDGVDGNVAAAAPAWRVAGVVVGEDALEDALEDGPVGGVSTGGVCMDGEGEGRGAGRGAVRDEGGKRYRGKGGGRGDGLTGRALTLRGFLAQCAERGEMAVPATDVVFEQARVMGLPREFVALAWWQFKARYVQGRYGAKRYVRWRAVFREAVRENWLRLWWFDAGQARLTVAGEGARRLMEGECAQRQEEAP